jgi:hypothetical protein
MSDDLFELVAAQEAGRAAQPKRVNHRQDQR